MLVESMTAEPGPDERPVGDPNDGDLLYPLDIALAAHELDRGTLSGLPLYYDRKVQPISLARFTRLQELGDPEYGPTAFHYIAVARTSVGAYHVCTSWLGTDMSFGRFGVPIIFETMVFAQDGWTPQADQFDPTDATDRYPTEDSARRGHEEMVTLVFLTAAQPEGVDPTPVTEFPTPQEGNTP